jgi:flavin reductase (DIM6/NTAB) family NADH-FMN oxidoreductase RutF
VALASTINLRGEVNLSPFSFFNVFSANPPVLIFSPALRVRDGSPKHTLLNVKEVPEAVIQVVPFAMVEQVSLASSEYSAGVNEFHKAGLSAMPSLKVAPPRVAESPIQLECKVLEVKPLGALGGAGNLVICEVLYFHVAREVMLPSGSIDPYAVDAVARLGGDWYTRSSAGLFEVEKPIRSCGIGVDALPAWLQESGFLDGNRLARLGNQPAIPSQERVREIGKGHFPEPSFDPHSQTGRTELASAIRMLLDQGLTEHALALAMMGNEDDRGQGL